MILGNLCEDEGQFLLIVLNLNRRSDLFFFHSIYFINKCFVTYNPLLFVTHRSFFTECGGVLTGSKDQTLLKVRLHVPSPRVPLRFSEGLNSFVLTLKFFSSVDLKSSVSRLFLSLCASGRLLKGVHNRLTIKYVNTLLS